MAGDRNEGWGWPAEARVSHYFRAGRSLCGKWGWLGAHAYLLTDAPPSQPCKTCEARRGR